jgi:hypothetical protein
VVVVGGVAGSKIRGSRGVEATMAQRKAHQVWIEQCEAVGGGECFVMEAHFAVLDGSTIGAEPLVRLGHVGGDPALASRRKAYG